MTVIRSISKKYNLLTISSCRINYINDIQTDKERNILLLLTQNDIN